MKAWSASGALADWRRALGDLAGLTYPKDGPVASTWDGGRLEIARTDLPYGTLRWEGTSGDRAEQAKLSGQPTPNYFKLQMPDWAAKLAPVPLSAAEQAAIHAMKP
jgi:hypothetical protein